MTLVAIALIASQTLGSASLEVEIRCPVADVSGTLLLPASGKHPCVVILGGTLSHDRDGAMLDGGAPPRAALKRLAEELLAAGYASLRYDKVGRGKSRPGPSWTGSYREEAEVAKAAIRYARERPEVREVIVAGESAGAYLACLAARDGVAADAYVFLGGFCGKAEELYEYNFGRLVRYAEERQGTLDWVPGNLRHALALGKSYRAMLEAAAGGASSYELVDGDFRSPVPLARRKEELDLPPDEMFRHIWAPALALSGELDLNVPPFHGARAAAILQETGNLRATSVVIPGADHSFQEAPGSLDERMRERYTFRSFLRPYDRRVYREIAAWLGKTVPAVAAPPRAVSGPELDPRTDAAPERLQLAPGVEIVDDVADRSRTAGVETLEGRIGPLLLAEGCQAHFIDMPGGMYLEEHPHSTESLIYTVRGRWVLVSRGRRHLMEPRSLFRFGAGVPTGYEVPFPEDSCILIFKGERSTRIEGEFIDYLEGLAARLREERSKGTPFTLRELPADHPARAFAREVNPDFEAATPGEGGHSRFRD